MISRSLGPEYGGAIGIIFSLANAIAVSMNVVGLSETVVGIIRDQTGHLYGISPTNWVRIIGCIAVIFLLGVALAGMEWESKAQIVFLIILLASFANYFIGSMLPASNFKKSRGFAGYKYYLFRENFKPSFRSETFFSIFSIYFPSATGILAGANISGDLKDASKAIPKGTFTAIVLTAISYIAMIWTIGGCGIRGTSGNVTDVNIDAGIPFYERGSTLRACEGTGSCKFGLIYDFQFVALASGSGPLISAGIFSATLSSAMACLVGASKVFQALCRDKLFPGIHIFGYGTKKNDDPIRAYFLAFSIAILFCILGDLNVIAPIISNFFLMAYALINYSCFHASLSKSVGFRPGFKYYNLWISLIGSFLCLVAMILIKWWAALVTLLAVLFLYFYVKIKQPNVNWGSSAQAHIYKDALESVIKLNETEEHVKNYRPQILALTGDPRTRPSFVDFANLFTKNISLLICAQVFVEQSEDIFIVDKMPVYAALTNKNIKALYNVTTASTYRKGIHSLMEISGLGRLRPNIVIMGYKNKWMKCSVREIEEYFNSIHDAFDLKLGVGILKVREGLDFSAMLFDNVVSESKAPPNQENEDHGNSDTTTFKRRYTLGGILKPNIPNGITNKSYLNEDDDYFSNENYVPNIQKTIYPTTWGSTTQLQLQPKPKPNGIPQGPKLAKKQQTGNHAKKSERSQKFRNPLRRHHSIHETIAQEFISPIPKRTPIANDPISKVIAKTRPLFHIFTKKGRETKEQAQRENIQSIQLLNPSSQVPKTAEPFEPSVGAERNGDLGKKQPPLKSGLSTTQLNRPPQQEPAIDEEDAFMPETTVIVRKPEDPTEAQLASIQNIDYSGPVKKGVAAFGPLYRSTSLMKLQNAFNISSSSTDPNTKTASNNPPQIINRINMMYSNRKISAFDASQQPKYVLGNIGSRVENMTRSISSFALNRRMLENESNAGTASQTNLTSISKQQPGNLEKLDESAEPSSPPCNYKYGKSYSQPHLKLGSSQEELIAQLRLADEFARRKSLRIMQQGFQDIVRGNLAIVQPEPVTAEEEVLPPSEVVVDGNYQKPVVPPLSASHTDKGQRKITVKKDVTFKTSPNFEISNNASDSDNNNKTESTIQQKWKRRSLLPRATSIFKFRKTQILDPIPDSPGGGGESNRKGRFTKRDSQLGGWTYANGSRRRRRRRKTLPAFGRVFVRDGSVSSSSGPDGGDDLDLEDSPDFEDYYRTTADLPEINFEKDLEEEGSDRYDSVFKSNNNRPGWTNVFKGTELQTVPHRVKDEFILDPDKLKRRPNKEPGKQLIDRSRLFGGSTESLNKPTVNKGKKRRRDKTEMEARKVKALIGRFRHNYTHGYIDVWWLFDDGGLTILLPFILSQRKLWRNCEMRVFAITNDKKQLDVVHQNFSTMLTKFRIDYSRVIVLPDINKLPYPTSMSVLEDIVSKYRVTDETDPAFEPGMITDQTWESNLHKTMRHVRLYEMLKQHSSESNIIFMTLPVPRKGSCPSSLYMAWLEMVTYDLNPPVFFIRGNQQSVLTFYS